MPIIGAVSAVGLGAAAVYFTSGGGSQDGFLKVEPIVDLKKQTVEVPVRKF